jgi:heme A synthase
MAVSANEASAGPAGVADRPSARQLDRLRGASMGALVMLIVQFAVGMIVNLYATLPAGDHNAGFWSAIGRALADGPAALTVHAILGLLLIVSAVALLGRAIACRQVPVIVVSAIGLLAILFAAVSGAKFVGNGLNSASISMAMATAVAMLCYAVSLYVLGSRRAG